MLQYLQTDPGDTWVDTRLGCYPLTLAYLQDAIKAVGYVETAYNQYDTIDSDTDVFDINLLCNAEYTLWLAWDNSVLTQYKASVGYDSHRSLSDSEVPTILSLQGTIGQAVEVVGRLALLMLCDDCRDTDDIPIVIDGIATTAEHLTEKQRLRCNPYDKYGDYDKLW